jgi:UDP-MurNAc hydroxylase
MDKIRWINHAGFELETQGIRIVCDPWIDGLAFAQSWAHIAPSKYSYDDFAKVNYIWFSHEHPDHFSPSNMSRIPEAVRRNITVLFQKTTDRRVAKFCEARGFKIREIDDWEKVELAPGVTITVKTVDEDSLCFIETPTHNYLNINDCVASDCNALHNSIKDNIKRPVDVLLTQFSYANWAGNPGDTATMSRLANQKLLQIQSQIDIYKPKVLIPFASFVWFCRTDNFHMNAGVNHIDAVHERFSAVVNCVTLYPGDTYSVGQDHDSSPALQRYRADEAGLVAPLKIDDNPILADELDQLSLAHQRKIRANNWMQSFWPVRIMGYLKPVRIHLTDIDRRLSYSMLSGISWLDNEARVDIAFASGAMAQMLRHGTGYDTLYISGRFAELTNGSRFMLARNFVALRKNEHGSYFPSLLFNWSYVRARLSAKG